jgi:ribose transport system substrate-binding protein
MSRIGKKRLMSRRLAVGGASMLLLVTAGCGSTPASSAGGQNSGHKADISLGKVGTTDELIDISKLCGTKKIKVALADGFGGNSWRKITRAEFEDEAKKCPNITEVLYTDGQNNVQKAISDINGLVAQNVDVIVVFADAGKALLPALRKATKAGVTVVAEIANPGGVVGTDYTEFVAEDVMTYGEQLAAWTVKAMGGKGNLVMLGGIAGNGYSNDVYQGVLSVAKQNPGIRLLNTDGPIPTNWEPGETQKVVAGLLTKYSTIDGIVSDYGGGSVGGIRAFQAANRSIPPWSANDSNDFACLWEKYRGANPNYQIATVSSRNWMSRLALRKGVAKVEGLDDQEPSIIKLPLFEDSLAGGKLQPKCDSTLPSDAILSSQLSHDQLVTLFR